MNLPDATPQPDRTGLLLWLTLGGGLCCLFTLSAIIFTIVMVRRGKRT
jgi:hypothetical protein